MNGLSELRDPRASALALRARRDPTAAEAAERILDAVARDGTAAVLRFTAQFDEVRLAESEMRISAAVLAHARKLAAPELLENVRRAHEAAQAFARAQQAALGEVAHAGARLRWIPREAAGIYLRRTHLRPQAIAARVALARVAGVRRLFAVTAPSARPTLPGAYGVAPLALATAAELGLDLFLAGGAQGVAQLARWTGDGGALVGSAGRHAAAALRLLAATHWVELAAAAPSLALVDSSASADALARAIGSVEIALALEDAAADSLARAAARSEVRAFRASRDQAVVFAQALEPARVLLLVREPERWLGELTCAGTLCTDPEREELLAPPLTHFMRQQPVLLPA